MNILTGDVMEWAASYNGPKFHALMCDPPYELGFMGRKWDKTGIAFQPETWAALAEHLYPGAFIFAFAGTRGYHRMACAMEDAGLLIHPAIGWLFGSGFPKATRIDTAIDRAAGVEFDAVPASGVGFMNAEGAGGWNPTKQPMLRRETTESAKAWAGHRYGMQALKPAFEFICVAQKPYSGKPVECITKTGAGALNIDKGRIQGGGINIGKFVRRNPAPECVYSLGKDKHAYEKAEYNVGGRWPANLCLDEVGAAALDRQSGVTRSRVTPETSGRESVTINFGMRAHAGSPHSDSGGASRFYHVSDWTPELAESDGFLYCAKAGGAERNAGLDGFRLQDSGVWDGRASQQASRCIGSAEGPTRNIHPCCKPLKLCRWLASLLLPPAEYAPRRILVPFAGSGSECIGAHLAGWEEIVGIEREAEYAEIARARLKFWQGNAGLFEKLTAEDEEPDPQGSLL